MVIDRLKRVLGAGEVTQLPARVHEAIRRQEDQTERLVGWVQLAIVMTFGLLYAFARQPGADLDFQPVPWALGVYAALTLVRVIWCRFGRLPGWAVMASIVIDMGLLMALIWSFHLQYGQPASFYLKAPTLLYVFIFIALRALRFDAVYVLLAGVAAVLSWLGLVYYATMVDPSDNMITRDYVEYLTSNSVLVGAELDKVISIGAVTAVLTVALVRGRRLLVRSVSEGMAAAELSRFFAPEVADRIKGAESSIRPGSAESREAAIMFLDLRGFTRLAESLPPAKVMALLGTYQGLVVPLVQRHGGRIDKFLGDGIMATFGAVADSKSYAADALRAMDAIMAAAAERRVEAVRDGEPPLEIGGAVATGRVLFGAIGSETRLEYTVIGEPVNLAAKLEKHNKAEAVRALTTLEAYRLAEAQGYVPALAKEERPRAEVAGTGNPVDLVVMEA